MPPKHKSSRKLSFPSGLTRKAKNLQKYKL